MTYVEWLRVRIAVKWTAIILGALLVLALAVRLLMAGFGKDDALAFVRGMQDNPNSRVVKTVLADGTKRTTIDNAKDGVHVVIDDNGYAGKHITITESSGHAESHGPKTVVVGSLNVQSSANGRSTVTTIDTDRPETFAIYAAFATFIALIVASALAAPFARENDGHLDIALTKPIDRTALALKSIGVDLLGLLAVWAMAVVFLLVGHSIFQMPRFLFVPGDLTMIVLGWLGIAAWYAMLCAITASMRRSFGIVLGLWWLVSLIVVAVAKARWGASLVAQTIHWVATVLAVVNPLYYLHFGPPMTVNGRPELSLAVSPQYEIPALAILALIYLSLAVLQWRRVEA
ncbi:MAG TPA: hypothetical protein VJP76_06505 [Candidatus Tumulicola sp.]|nr:hypothetical protein [Candidatus Tumulicola sp.]